MPAPKRPQLRICTYCHKPGHNKATCPDFKLSPIPSNKKPPVKVVVHERPQTVTRSSHLLNLKTHITPWQKIESASPEKNTSLYYHYHEPEKITTEPKLAQLKPAAKKITIKKPLLSRVHSYLIRHWDKLKQKFTWEKNQLTLSGSARNKNTAQNGTLKQWLINYFTSWKISGRPAFVLAAFIFIFLILPLQAYIFYQNANATTKIIAANGTKGFLSLQESTAAIMRADLNVAEISANSALNELNSAVDILNTNHKFLLKIISFVPVIGNEIQSRQNIITAGQKIAEGNALLIKGVNASQKNPNALLTNRIATITKFLQLALPNYQTALENLNQVDPSVLPEQFQAPFSDFKPIFSAVLNDLNNLTELGQTVQEIFGGQGLRRYLLIFQNPHEIRPTGGFIGSFAVMDIKDGKIINLEIPAGGSYDLQGQLDQFVEPPAPLLLANKRWEFQDANWFPDFPASAEKMLWFYRHSRQLTADGVIAINASVLERLLSIIGPVTDEQRSITLASDNAIATIQKIVEEGPEKQLRKPKQILTDLTPKLLDQLMNLKPNQALPVLMNISEALEQKEIQAYFTDAKTQSTISSFGWAGQILPTQKNQDYLFVVNTNIRGEKSDAEIKQTISHQATIRDNGEVTAMVTVTRQHLGINGEKLYGATNIDYLRIYVPENSELISVSGFTWPDESKFRAPDPMTKKDTFLNSVEKEIKIDDISGTRITSEFGKTAFGNWIITEPGKTSQIQFTYRLPFKVFSADQTSQFIQKFLNKLFNSDSQTSHYQLAVQRQSGIDSDFESQIIYPASWQPSWNDGADSTLALNGLSIFVAPLKQDTVWSLIMKQK